MRTLFHLLENLGEVLAEDADAEEVERAEKQHEQNRGRDAGRAGLGKSSRPAICNGPSTTLRPRSKTPAKLMHVQRRVAEAENALLRPADVLEQVVGAPAEHPLGPHVVDARLLETDERAHPAQEQVALREAARSPARRACPSARSRRRREVSGYRRSNRRRGRTPCRRSA